MTSSWQDRVGGSYLSTVAPKRHDKRMESLHEITESDSQKRNRDESLTVYELDLPLMLADKQARAEKAGLAPDKTASPGYV